MIMLPRGLVALLALVALTACTGNGASTDAAPGRSEAPSPQIETDDEPTRVVTVNPGDTSGCVQMINIDTSENYFFNFDPINGSSPAYDTQSCNDIHIPGDTFHIPIPDNVPDGTYRFCLQDCQTIRVG